MLLGDSASQLTAALGMLAAVSERPVAIIAPRGGRAKHSCAERRSSSARTQANAPGASEIAECRARETACRVSDLHRHPSPECSRPDPTATLPRGWRAKSAEYVGIASCQASAGVAHSRALHTPTRHAPVGVSCDERVREMQLRFCRPALDNSHAAFRACWVVSLISRSTSRSAGTVLLASVTRWS
jgi:hypothetical protein